MYIKKETLAELANKGITVSYHPQGLNGAKDAEYQKRVNQIRTLRDGQSIWNGEKYLTATATDADVQAYAEKYMYEFDPSNEHFHYYERRRWYDATLLYIQYGTDKLIVKKENAKSKEITVEYICKLIDKNEKAYSGYYGTFALNMQKLLKENGLDNCFSVYPTTYGIGVWVIYNFRADKDIDKVTALLDARHVEYYNEFSEHGWVYRYKVSKRADNIARVA